MQLTIPSSKSFPEAFQRLSEASRSFPETPGRFPTLLKASSKLYSQRLPRGFREAKASQRRQRLPRGLRSVQRLPARLPRGVPEASKSVQKLPRGFPKAFQKKVSQTMSAARTSPYALCALTGLPRTPRLQLTIPSSKSFPEAFQRLSEASRSFPETPGRFPTLLKASSKLYSQRLPRGFREAKASQRRQRLPRGLRSVQRLPARLPRGVPEASKSVQKLPRGFPKAFQKKVSQTMSA